MDGGDKAAATPGGAADAAAAAGPPFTTQRWRVVDSRRRGWPVTPAGSCPQQEEGLGVLQHLGLAGVNRVANPMEPWSRRVAWAAVLACGLAGTIFLISDKAQQYLRRPTTMRVSYDDANLTALPGVTICPSDKFDFHNLLRLWRKAGRRDKMPKDVDLKLLGVSNLTLEEVWRQGGFHLHRLVAQCYVGPGRRCEGHGVWRSTFTRYGLCHTFSGAFTSTPGPHFGIYLQLRYRGHPYGYKFRGFKVAVHDPLRLASEAIEDGMPCPQKITKTRRKLGCHRLVSVTLQHVKLLDRTSRPCRQEANYSSKVCRLTCLHAHVLRRHGCRLPYMLGEGRACRTEEEVRRVSGAIYHLHDYGRFNYTAACDCPPACTLSIYRANTDTTWNTQRNSVVKVFMEGTQSERVEESYAYPVPALVSHIGGFMGLLLGASILSFLQLLEIPLLKAYALAVWALQECGRMLGGMGLRRQAWTSVGSGSLHQATRKEQTD